MPVSLTITNLPSPRVSEAMLHGPVQTLREIKARCEERFGRSDSSPEFRNRKASLRERLIHRTAKGESFAEATNLVGRERLLLSIYLDELGKTGAQLWLPPFDQQMALHLLGKPGESLSGARARQATHLFFTHFDKLDGLQMVCQRLQEAYQSSARVAGTKVSVWSTVRSVLFTPEGHTKIASNARREETIDELRQRYALPSEGRFAESLRYVFLLESLLKCSFGSEPATLEQIEQSRIESAPDSLPLGAAALRILVRRVMNEGGRWPEGWQKWIVRLGCDPRFGRASVEGTKWWRWATDSELRLAQQGVTGLTLRFFIEFLQRSLKGTDKEPQFRLRSRFLLALFDSNKIIDARLALNWVSLQRLDARYRDTWSVAHLSATDDDTSMIALRCTDDVFIIEGTHSFGLRAFHRAFPVAGFWERSKKIYQDKDIRISPSLCPIFVRHAAGGSWVESFFSALRRRFHVEWGDVRLNASSSAAVTRSFETPANGSTKVTPQTAPAVTALYGSSAPSMSASQTQPNQSQDYLTKPDVVVADYIEYLTRFLARIGRREGIAPRTTLLRMLVATGKVREARLVTDMNDRSMLVMRCTHGMTLVDAVHYLNLRGLCDKGVLWQAVDTALHDGARLARLRGETGYQLRVNHLPPEGYAKRFLDQLAENCGVAWDDVMF